MFGNEDVNMELPYSGSVNISLYFNESTDLIVLHSVSLNITKVSSTIYITMVSSTIYYQGQFYYILPRSVLLYITMVSSTKYYHG